jgi:hypothetical protein
MREVAQRKVSWPGRSAACQRDERTAWRRQAGPWP